MKRSVINAEIDKAIALCHAQNFHLPPWAYWSVEQWRGTGHEADEIRRCGLGWDVTDFGSGDFPHVGLVLFTLRNGEPDRPSGIDRKDYCEKLLFVAAAQVTPIHCHKSKMEDIINRGGGRLVIEAWHRGQDGGPRLDESAEVTLSVDGIERAIPAGGRLVLTPGESVALPPLVYHTFYGEPGGPTVLGGEVSRLNDDVSDNCFLDPLPRFPGIDEDALPRHLLCNEYPAPP